MTQRRLHLGDPHEELAGRHRPEVGLAGAVAPRPEGEEVADRADVAVLGELLGGGGDDRPKRAGLGGHVTPPR